MDTFDRSILHHLAQNGRLSWTELAEFVNLSASAVQRRVQALQSKGAIKHFTVSLDTKELGNEVRAFVEVKVERSNIELAKGFRESIRLLPQVQSCHKLSGTVDFILDVVSSDLETYGRFLEQEILSIPGVLDAKSSIILEEVKAFKVMI